MGIRFTWTLKTDIKMLILIDGCPKGLLFSLRCRTSNIVPSAGVSTASLESEVGLRLGSLKKKMIKRRTMPARIEMRKEPVQTKRKVTPPLITIKGIPSFATGNLLLIRESSTLYFDGVYPA